MLRFLQKTFLKFETFLHTYLSLASQNRFVQEGKYFACGPLEQKCVCMECIRDALYEYLGNEYVKIEQRRTESKVSSAVYKMKVPTSISWVQIQTENPSCSSEATI